LNSIPCPTDTDKNGMPDAWEIANGLNQNNPADGNTVNNEGFTMLEVYMNSLVANIMTDGIEGGVPMGSTIGNSNPNTSTVTLSQSTYVGEAGAGSPWNFDNGYSITNTNSKAYATGSELGVKYSTGVKFTVNLPSKITVDTVNFIGYDNYAGTDSYLSELNGTTYGTTDYIFTQKDGGGKYVICNRKIPLVNPATGAFTFTFGGNQVVMKILLAVRTTTATEKIFNSPLDPNGLTNVFTLDGRKIKSNIIRMNATQGLANGLYIIDQQKRMINN